MMSYLDVAPEIGKFFDGPDHEWNAAVEFTNLAGAILDAPDEEALDVLIADARIAFAKSEGINPTDVDDLALSRAIDGAIWFICDRKAYDHHYGEKNARVLEQE